MRNNFAENIGLENDRIVQICAPNENAKNQYQVGTGYAVTKRMILTAYHFLEKVDREQIEISFIEGELKDKWIKVQLHLHSDSEMDFCLLKLPFDLQEIELLKWGEYTRKNSIIYNSCGFPGAAEIFLSKEQVLRDSAGIKGEITISGGLKQSLYELTTESPPSKASFWRGISGAPVFAGGALVGIIKSAPERFSAKRLMAVPVTRMLKINAFSDAIGNPTVVKVPPDPSTNKSTTILPFYKLPAKPAEYVPRHDELRKISDILTKKDNTQITCKKIALRGAGGFGKTTLAKAIVNDRLIRQYYSNSIYWITFKETSSIDNLLSLFYLDLTGEKTDSGFQIKLIEILKKRKFLLVIDDVWYKYLLDPFLEIVEESMIDCIFTTRLRKIASDTHSMILTVGNMDNKESRELLLKGVDQSLILDDGLLINDIIHRLGRWPLLLKLANSMLKMLIELGEDNAIEEIGKIYDELGVVGFDDNPEHRREAVTKTLNASLKYISDEDKEGYFKLAVFPKNSDIPLAAASTLWNLSKVKTKLRLWNLENLALIMLNLRDKTFRFHDSIHDYIIERSSLKDKSLHEFLIEAYQKKQPGNWSSLEDDGYIFQHLIMHLVLAQRKHLAERLLFNFKWLKARLAVSNIIELITDFDHIKSKPNDPIITLKSALRLSTHALVFDKSQLAGQLSGRLKFVNNKNIQKLLRDINPNHAWIRPTITHLTPPGPLLRILKGHKDAVTALCASSNGKYIVSSSSDQTIVVWDAISGQAVKTFKGHTGSINDLALTPDSRYAMSASDDKSIKIWDLKKLSFYKSLDGHNDCVKAIAISSCGRYALSAQSNISTDSIKVWNLDHFRDIQTLSSKIGVVNRVAFHPNKNQAILASGDSMILQNITDVKPVPKIMGEGKDDLFFKLGIKYPHYIKAMAISPNGKYLFCGLGLDYYDPLDEEPGGAYIIIWDLNSRKKAGHIGSHKESINALAVSHDSLYLISGGGCIGKTNSENIVKIWDISNKREVKKAHPDQSPLTSIAASHSKLKFYSGYLNGEIKEWHIEKLADKDVSPPYIGHFGIAVNSVRITSNAKFLVSASDDCQIKVWNIDEKKKVNSTIFHSDCVHDIAFVNGEQQILSVGRDSTLRLHDLLSAEVLMTANSMSAECAYAIAVASNNRFCATGEFKRNNILMWKLENQQIELKHILKGHTKYVKTILITADNKQVFSGSNDHTIKMWDSETGHELETLSAHKGPVSSLAITPDGKYLASASLDGSILIWNLKNIKRPRTLLQLPYGINALAISPDGQNIIAGDNDYAVQVINFHTGKIVAKLNGESPILCCDIAQDGTTIAVGDMSGRVGVVCLKGAE